MSRDGVLPEIRAAAADRSHGWWGMVRAPADLRWLLGEYDRLMVLDAVREIGEIDRLSGIPIRKEITVNEYQDIVEVDGLHGAMTVEVATFGRADEIGSEPYEIAPVRLRVTDHDEQVTAEAYLSLGEAGEVVAALHDAIERAKSYPQPAR